MPKKLKKLASLTSVVRTAESRPKAPKASNNDPVEQPAHILIRMSTVDDQTVNDHLRIIAARGAAVFGKMGRPLGPGLINELNDQISHGVDTYFFLTMKQGWNGPYVTYQCPLRQLYGALPDSKLALVPKYYSHAYKTIGTWFEIAGMERMSRLDMNRIFVISSGREIMSVMSSTAAVFRVGLRPKGST